MATSTSLALMGAAIGAAAILAACLRRGGARWRAGAAGAMLTALSIGFLKDGGTPFLSPTGEVSRHGTADQILAGLWWILAASGLSFLLQYTLGHDGRSRQSRLLSDLLSAAIYLSALLAVMSFVLRLPLSGLVATSGIVAVVLGLALQSTLADLFSGIAVGVEQPFRLGDRINVDGGVEGTVSQINWRSIRISTDDNDVAIIPNSTVAKARIINRSYPSCRRGMQFEIAVSAHGDPERAIALITHGLLLTRSVSENPKPSVGLLRLSPRNNVYVVHAFVDDMRTLGRTKSEALQHIRSRLLQAGLLLRDPLPPTVEARDLLASLPLFESLTVDQISALRDCAEMRHLPTGTPLFEQGDIDTNLYVLTDGVLEISRKDEAGRIEVGGRIGGGDYIGEIGLMTGAAKQVSAIAKTHSNVLVIGKAALDPLIESLPKLGEAFKASVQRGYVLLEHGRVVQPVEYTHGLTDILPRLRAFFHPTNP